MAERGFQTMTGVTATWLDPARFEGTAEALSGG